MESHEDTKALRQEIEELFDVQRNPNLQRKTYIGDQQEKGSFPIFVMSGNRALQVGTLRKIGGETFINISPTFASYADQIKQDVGILFEHS